MIKLWLLLLCLVWVSVTSSHAQVYRWVDKDGNVNFTDNPSRIPADRVDQSRELSPDDPRGHFTRSGSPASSPAIPSSTTESPPVTGSEALPRLREKERALAQQIAAAQEERQLYLKKIESVRPVRTNPAFGGKRRRVETIGQSLAAVERQLDTLRTELQQVQTEIQQAQQPLLSSSASQSPIGVAFDNQGHDRAYWQRRVSAVHARLRQAREQRKEILEQLSADHPGTYGRRGREVLNLTRTLDQVDRNMRNAEADLQTLQQKATRAGAPAEWLQ